MINLFTMKKDQNIVLSRIKINSKALCDKKIEKLLDWKLKNINR